MTRVLNLQVIETGADGATDTCNLPSSHPEAAESAVVGSVD